MSTAAPTQAPPLLEVRNVTVDYGTGPGAVRAVHEVDLVIRQGEAVGLAGESGSGKSTLAMAITRLLRDPAVIAGGQVMFHGGGDTAPFNVLELDQRALRAFRWQEVAIVLQSAMNALNPVLNLRAQLTDVLRGREPRLSKQARVDRAGELLDIVGVNRDRLGAYPHELSGGMRQRAMIAMAMALQPKLIVMDEPTTALDVVTQRQILEELAELRARFGFAMLFITHDLSLLLETADTIAVMYAGRLIEVAPASDIYRNPAHPYTVGLLGSFPPLSGARRKLTGIPGSPPDLRSLPAGCSFAPRCSFAAEDCMRARPELRAPACEPSSDRVVACFHDRAAADPAPGDAR